MKLERHRCDNIPEYFMDEDNHHNYFALYQENPDYQVLISPKVVKCHKQYLKKELCE